MAEDNAKILIVEDDATIARFVELELTHIGYEVAKYARRRVGAGGNRREHRPDLVLLDLMLPGIDGIEVARTLRERGEQMPILMLTARAETHDVVVGFDAGADDYLRKPFEIPELLVPRPRAAQAHRARAPALLSTAPPTSRSIPRRAACSSTASR